MAWLLLPVGWLFFLVVALRRLGYRLGLLASVRLPVPVVVVGNITVGGSGKTPLVIWLVDELRRRGRHPGVISRGHGGDGGVCEVRSDSAAAEVGDEPLLIRRRTGCPVFVGRDRAAAGRALLAAHPDCDLLVADDGLQHYRLARDLEIAVVDGRGLQNGWPLPAGPLREPARRLRQVQAVVANGWGGAAGYCLQLAGDRFYRLGEPAATFTAEALPRAELHAVAGIGDPSRFFAHLAGLGLHFAAHAFPDHHPYGPSDLAFAGGI
ncbi:MAG TPA: tetraacyldisaccharide 4'-kinase, partial [Rhodocyclaceae bacterium]|nr:tetraacyldisaccharide 4'-kinase [Rhodocyclaceae bacterium]